MNIGTTGNNALVEAKPFILYAPSINLPEVKYYPINFDKEDRVIYESIESHYVTKFSALFYVSAIAGLAVPAFSMFTTHFYLSLLMTLPIGVCAEMLSFVYPRYARLITKIELSEEGDGTLMITLGKGKPGRIWPNEIQRPTQSEFVHFHMYDSKENETMYPIYIQGKRCFIDNKAEYSKPDILKAVINGVPTLDMNYYLKEVRQYSNDS